MTAKGLKRVDRLLRDKIEALLKTLTYREYHQYLDKYWRAHSMYMENHLTGKSTLLTW